VDSRIDGKVRWIEHNAPYNYGSEASDGHLGISDHHVAKGRAAPFTARAVDSSGRAASNTVTARVLSAPAPPGTLAGRWTRAVTAADIKKSGPMPPRAGQWKLIFDRVGAWHIDPDNGGVVNQYARPA
jgi:hypothetical protein